MARDSSLVTQKHVDQPELSFLLYHDRMYGFRKARVRPGPKQAHGEPTEAHPKRKQIAK